ncbi:MAG TPA: WG repeat-containing protein [Pyrinomonadaceae bacterium]|nr:WG repeat-containing protein [Pyrinomonadaceae bacterium]
MKTLKLLGTVLIFAAGIFGQSVSGELFPIYEGGKYGLIDRTGKVVVEPTFTTILGSDDSADLFLTVAVDTFEVKKSNKRWGLINRAGEWAVPPQFDDAGPFHEGYAVVRENGKYKYINEKGEVLTGGFDYAKTFSEGLAVVNVGGKWGYIDLTGRVAIPLQYSRPEPYGPSMKQSSPISSFSEGLAGVEIGGRNAYINKAGTIVLWLPKGVNGADFSEEYAVVWQWNSARAIFEYGLIDKTGKLVIPMVHRHLFEVSEGLVGYQSGLKFGFLSTSGSPVIEAKFDRVEEFASGRAKVKIGEKYGFIDHTGWFVIPPIFDAASSFFDGLASVDIGDAEYYIDTSGNVVYPVGAKLELKSER